MQDPQTTTDVVMFSHSMRVKLETIKASSIVAAYLLEENNLVTDGIHHITLRDGDQMISFCPAGKQQQYAEDGKSWKLEGRQTMAIGRMVRKILKPTIAIADRNIEEFGEMMQVTYEGKKPYTLKLIKGEAIAEWYHHRKYVSDEDCENGSDCSLWQSCMRYDSCQGDDNHDQPFFGLYTGNAKRVQMLIQVRNKDKKLMSRALVWKLDDGRYYLDRIYTCASKYIKELQQYARSNGWLYKYQQANSNNAFADHTGHKLDKTVAIISNIDTDFRNYPYMDTFAYAYIKDSRKGFVSNFPCEWDGKMTNTVLNDTDGSYSCVDFYKCADTLEVVESDRARIVSLGNYAGQHCYYGNVTRIVRNGRSINVMYDDTLTHSLTERVFYKDDLVQDCEGSWCEPHELVEFEGKKYATWKNPRQYRSIPTPSFIETSSCDATERKDDWDACSDTLPPLPF